MNEKISIVIPAYNIEKYLKKTIDSVLNQTYVNIEVIVVDDGSKDGTGTIIDEFAKKDCRVKAIHKKNGGVTSARLAGVQVASGEWIGFVDGDDYIEAEMYEHLLRNAKKYDALISHCGYQMVFPNRVEYYYNTGRLVQQDKLTGLKDLLAGSFIEPGLWNKLFHKTLFHSLLQEDKMPLNIKINEDLLMNYWLFKECDQAIYEDFCPYHYVLRRGSAATSNVNKNKLEDPIKVMKLLLEDVKGNKDLEKIIWTKLLRQYINLATMPYANNKNIIQPYKQMAYKELKKLRRFALKQKNFGLKLKIMILWVSIFPKSYEWLHRVYSKLSGHDKKYSVED